MDLDLPVAVGGLFVGLTVGLTGMGGGALMTPMLVLLFGVNPLTAVSSDIVASVVMKPVGGSVHARRGTVHRGIVMHLVLGSVPAAFAGVLLLRLLGEGPELEDRLETLLGAVLLVAATAMALKAILQRRRPTPLPPAEVVVRPLPTVLVGIAGGLVVGLTSVGSGSLMIVLLLALYPRLSASSLVGTDLVQAVPLVASAAIGHLLFGDFALALTASLLLGCVPGAYAGAHLSVRAPDHVIRPLLVVVLVASATKLLGASVGLAAAAGLLVGGAAAFATARSNSRETAAGEVEPATAR